MTEFIWMKAAEGKFRILSDPPGCNIVSAEFHMVKALTISMNTAAKREQEIRNMRAEINQLKKKLADERAINERINSDISGLIGDIRIAEGR